MKETMILRNPHGWNHGGVFDTDICPTITTSSFEHNNLLVEIYEEETRLLFQGKVRPSMGGVYTNDSVDFNHGGLDGLSRTIKANSHDAGVCVEQTNEKDMAKRIRIRKLTPRTCFRLQGLSDADIDKIKDAGISDSQCYKIAGNSICVPVLEAIFTQMFRADSDALF